MKKLIATVFCTLAVVLLVGCSSCNAPEQPMPYKGEAH